MWCQLLYSGDALPGMRVRVPYPVEPSGMGLFPGRIESATPDGVVSIHMWETGDRYSEDFGMYEVSIEVDTNGLQPRRAATPPEDSVPAAPKPSASSPTRPAAKKSRKTPTAKRRADASAGSAEINRSGSSEGVGGGATAARAPAVSRDTRKTRQPQKKLKAAPPAKPRWR